uniref:Uncharacterized protein n=1 Tax=Corethron hystrix TaxID=216773 RepID=A0A7S1BA02_9STRA|mmetsp:Transcript_18905/g.43087  ORF Transcript_18905/g.43087 Transcript_18905/m.43087 type:complete len:235 (+) Transcript_18905:85-789(+)
MKIIKLNALLPSRCVGIICSVLTLIAAGMFKWRDIVPTSDNDNSKTKAFVNSFSSLSNSLPGGSGEVPDLPPFLTTLSKDDDDYDDLYNIMTKYALKSEGVGGFKEAEIVAFTREHVSYRLYGGKAELCGHWWTMDSPSGTSEDFDEHFAVCPEWNDATTIGHCTVPPGYKAIVGIGQTATCADGEVLDPPASVLQLYGDVCAITDIVCTFCSAHQFSLETSACVANNDTSRFL